MTKHDVVITFIFLAYISIIFTYFVTIIKNKNISIRNTFFIITSIIFIFLLNSSYVFYIEIPLYFLLILLYIYIMLYIYIILYNVKRLDLSSGSFISFLLNMFFLSLFIIGFYNMIYKINAPIYLQDLSIFSYYRYLVLLILSMIVLCLYLSSKYIYPSLNIYFKWINFPYLKHHMFILLDGIYIDRFSSFIINIFIDYKYTLLIIDIFFSYIVSIVNLLFFFNFILNNGDLCWNLYLLPISFMGFIYGYIKFFYIKIFDETCNYIRLVLNVNVKNSLVPAEKDIIFLYRSLDELNFHITPYGYSEGFEDKGLLSLKTIWLRLARIYHLMYKYNKYAVISSVIFSFRILSWVLLIGASSVYLQAGWTNQFSRVSFKSFHSSRVLLSPTRAYYVKKEFKQSMETATNGTYKSGHPIATDMDMEKDGKVPFQHQPTHGKGSPEHPSKPMHPSEDLRGEKKPQNATFPKEFVEIPKDWLHSEPIKDSEKFYENPIVKENIKKYATEPDDKS